MKTIWKYPLDLQDKQTVMMPEGAEILTVQMQGAACLWALVDSRNVLTDRVIEIFGTGNPMHSDMGVERRYIGTIQQPPFVWHVFERVN